MMSIVSFTELQSSQQCLYYPAWFRCPETSLWYSVRAYLQTCVRIAGFILHCRLISTSDDTLYSHYSSISTVEGNWGLGNLGRGDVNKTMSNLFKCVLPLFPPQLTLNKFTVASLRTLFIIKTSMYPARKSPRQMLPASSLVLFTPHSGLHSLRHQGMCLGLAEGQ